jgi:hypothetical protein
VTNSEQKVTNSESGKTKNREVIHRKSDKFRIKGEKFTT